MTTYGTDLRIGTSPRGNTATLPRTQGSLNRTAKTFPGGKSEIKPFRQATNKSPTVAPKSPSSDSTAQTVGKAAKGVAGIGKKTLGKISPGIGINSKGDIDIGLKAGGAGISLSTKGEISLGIGIGQVTFDPKNLNVGKVELGLGVASSEATQDGCTITITDRIMGKIVNQYIRQADDCVEPEPTPTPTPVPTPIPTPSPTPQPKTYKRYTAGHYAVYQPTVGEITYPWDEARLAWDTYLKTTPTSGYYNPSAVFKSVKEMFEQYMFIEKMYLTHGHIQNLLKAGYGHPNQGEILEHLIIGAEITVEFSSSQLRYFDPDTMINKGVLRTGRHVGWMDYYTWGTPGTNLLLIPLDPESINPKFSAPGRSIPKVTEQCDCELLEDIYDMLGGDDFRDDGLEIPNHLFIPGGTGETKALTYNALLNLMFRTLDHRTVGEVEVSIKDNNIMKEGDQGLTMRLINATAATGKILELSQKQDSDLTAVLNLLMRLSWISVQILKVVNIGSEATKTIVSFFAIPVKEKVINVDIPVDPSLGGKIGFDPKKPSEDQLIKILDLDDPQKTISIFDKFMNNSKIPVKVKQFIGDRSGGNYWWLMDKNKK
jgi:hypothetical protein